MIDLPFTIDEPAEQKPKPKPPAPKPAAKPGPRKK